MKNLQAGPAKEFGSALKTGDLSKAMKELDKLKEKLAKNELDEKDREKLAKQLTELEETLRKAADAQKLAERELHRTNRAGAASKATWIRPTSCNNSSTS